MFKLNRLRFAALGCVLAMTASSQAAEPIYVGGTKYSYSMADFTPVYASDNSGQITGYYADIPVYVDEWDDYYGHPELVFDLRSEVKASLGSQPLKLSFSATCSDINIGDDADLVFQRRQMLIPARFSVFKRQVTEGQCKNLHIEIDRIGTSITDVEAIIDSISMTAVIGINLN